MENIRIKDMTKEEFKEYKKQKEWQRRVIWRQSSNLTAGMAAGKESESTNSSERIETWTSEMINAMNRMCNIFIV